MKPQHHSYSTQIIYTPQSKIRNPLKLLQEMGKDLFASRELAWRLLVRDISAQYRQSILGIFWAFLPPILTAAGLVFAKNAGGINVGETEIPYPAFVMFSMALWQTFIESLNGPITALAQAKPMLAKINFPREAIILAKIGEVLFNFGIKLILIIALFIWFKISVPWTIFIAPVALIHLIIFGTGIGLLVAPLSALYQDISRAIPLITTPWLLITPVLFPTPKQGILNAIVNINPVTHLLVTTRDLATTGVIAQPMGFWISSGLAFVLLFLGWILFRLSLPFIIERMSS